MKHTTKNYDAPQVELIKLQVEQGFALSPYIDEEPGMTGSLNYDSENNDFDL